MSGDLEVSEPLDKVNLNFIDLKETPTPLPKVYVVVPLLLIVPKLV